MKFYNQLPKLEVLILAMLLKPIFHWSYILDAIESGDANVSLEDEEFDEEEILGDDVGDGEFTPQEEEAVLDVNTVMTNT